MSNSVVVVVAGEDKSGEVFNAVKKHLDETKLKAKETSESLGQIGEHLKRGLEMAGVAVGVRELAEGFKRMVESAIDTAVQLGHLNQQTGISIENLSVLKYVSAQTGIEFDVLTRGFKKLAVTSYDAEHGSKQAAKGFEQAGITAEQLKSKGNDMYAVLALVADKFHAMPDGIAKSDTAAKIFGARMGSELIPLLNQGSGAIEGFRAEAESLGLVLDDAGIKKLEEMHKKLEAVKGAFHGLGLELTTFLAPTMNWFAKEWVELIQDMRASPGATMKGMYGFGLTAMFGKAGPGIEIMADAQRQINEARAPHFLGPDALAKWLRANPNSGERPSDTGEDNGTGGGKTETPIDSAAQKAALRWEGINHGTSAALQKAKDDWAALQELNRIEGQKAWDAVVAQGNSFDPSIFEHKAQQVVLAVPKAVHDYSAEIEGAAEKMAHGVFDPLFDLSMKWDEKWKAMRDGLLRDLGQLAESQLFKLLFGDPQGRGGAGLSGTSFEGNTENPRAGVQGAAGGLLGGLLGHFLNRGAAATSNGGVGSGAGTVPTAAASFMQLGKGAGSNGGIQVVLNNTGAPLEVSQTQKNDGGEQQVIQIMLKQLETNGPVAQGIMGLAAML